MIHPERILIVDDEPMILAGLQRQLRSEFTVVTAEGAEAGLRAFEEDGPFAVVVSDMRMPRISGVQFLERVGKQWPNTIRLMLTGNADQKTAIDAVNLGHIYRFLNKPCPTEILKLALESALELYRRERAEHELLSETLNGSIGLLSEVLAILRPLAFGRIAGIRRIVDQISAKLPAIDPWETSAAAMLAFIGCITLDDNILNRYFAGMPLQSAELQTAQKHSEAGARLITRIPRLGGVAEIVRRQNEPYKVTLERGDADDLGLCANILNVAIEFERRISGGLSHTNALAELKAHPQIYNPNVVSVLHGVVFIESEVRNITIEELVVGMILDQPLLSLRGDLLLAAGQVVGDAMKQRLLSIADSHLGIRQPFQVRGT